MSDSAILPPSAAARPRRHRPPATPLLDFDVVIIGAGSAGLSAALVLGRSLRRVLVCDGGAPRNVSSPGVHGFLTRDGAKPADLLRLGREQLQPYTTVELRPARVLAVAPMAVGFELTLEGETGRNSTCTARKILLATGVEDELPVVEGMREFWGTGVLHCPYCHGWEVRDQPLAVYGRGKTVTGLALLVSRWSKDVVVCTDGPGGLTDNARRRLRRQGIQVREEEIRQLAGTGRGELRHIVFQNGEKLPRTAVFIHAHQHQRAQLAEQLGCRFTKKGSVWVDKNAQTTLPGLYAAGDNTPGTQQALLAAAKGSQAAICINEQLTREECPK
ncbi:NAD(P)/FAD-dependent oxidoreductase [Hymenobacter sediminicola]|uniref:NAD(P)/FAD-dependent oxidoreductase n=1 Tax=Hymenobacter sediminicola TaxID=2761579 RepID=A0A7G7W7X9_9BACT|nr:NAD(P)/FAD-dependent oxidoreductase [Hymenobacter sediminicola]QNH62472.1 NAD(P)/FAD-dependent oxidoreductase [Hymenobacter sediminicola]